MTSHPPLEATSSSLFPSPTSPDVGGHPLRFSGQMQNPFCKTRAFESAVALVAGDDGAFEFTVSTIELGLISQDALVEGPESYDISLESPIVGGVIDLTSADSSS